jgi:hypothetical protein
MPALHRTKPSQKLTQKVTRKKSFKPEKEKVTPKFSQLKNSKQKLPMKEEVQANSQTERSIPSPPLHERTEKGIKLTEEGEKVVSLFEIDDVDPTYVISFNHRLIDDLFLEIEANILQPPNPPAFLHVQGPE